MQGRRMRPAPSVGLGALVLGSWCVGVRGLEGQSQAGVPAHPSPHPSLCPQRVSLAPQIGPVVVAKRHRSSVAPPSTVSRDPSALGRAGGRWGCRAPVPAGHEVHPLVLQGCEGLGCTSVPSAPVPLSWVTAPLAMRDRGAHGERRGAAARHILTALLNQQVSVPPAPPPAEVPEPTSSLPPATLVPPRRSRQGHRVSTRAGCGQGGMGRW